MGPSLDGRQLVRTFYEPGLIAMPTDRTSSSMRRTCNNTAEVILLDQAIRHPRLETVKIPLIRCSFGPIQSACIQWLGLSPCGQADQPQDLADNICIRGCGR